MDVTIEYQKIVLRGYPVLIEDKPSKPRVQERTCHSNRFLIFDTETLPDEYQPLTFGSAIIGTDDHIEEAYLFYNENLLSNDQVKTLERYGARHGYTVLTRTRFVDEVFIPLVYMEGVMCMSYNLPFDLSRLAIGSSYSTYQDGGFSLVLSNRTWSAENFC